MSHNHFIACDDCKQFIEIHQWCPSLLLDAIREPQPLSLAYAKVEITVADLVAAANLLDESDDFRAFLISPLQFAQHHTEHSLVLYKSLGDTPWYPDAPNWHNWKKHFSPPHHTLRSPVDIDLPRNIIFDLGISEWPNALQHYLDNCPCVEDPENLQKIYESYMLDE